MIACSESAIPLSINIYTHVLYQIESTCYCIQYTYLRALTSIMLYIFCALFVLQVSVASSECLDEEFYEDDDVRNCAN